MLTAITREPSPAIQHCQLSFVEREPIVFELAREQHANYERLLEELGVTIERLPPQPALPDAVFVEDTAVVVEELAVMTRPPSSARASEVPSVGTALRKYRPVIAMGTEGHLEGGDVLRVGQTVYIGMSARTDEAGLRRLRELLAPLGYEVRSVPFRGCLHLKTACTFVGQDTILINPSWVSREHFPGFRSIEVHQQEAAAANALRIKDCVIMPSSFPRTAERLSDQGFNARTIDVSELQKAEAGVTCCSIVFGSA